METEKETISIKLGKHLIGNCQAYYQIENRVLLSDCQFIDDNKNMINTTNIVAEIKKTTY